MRFEWDEEKDRGNLAKHKLSFETARLVFDDPLAVSVPDRVVEGEERWRTLGRVGRRRGCRCCRPHVSERRGGRDHPPHFRAQGDASGAEDL